MERWGGLPSKTIFRHVDTRIDPVTKARYHAKLASLVQTDAPTPEREAADSATADAIYHAWANYVRVHTRDTKKYALLFQENISYGFRRNVLGLRTFAVVLSGLCLLAAIVAVFVRQLDSANAAAVVINLGFLAFWMFVVREDWVKTPAFGYAQQMAEAVDTLGGAAAGAIPPKKAPPMNKKKGKKDEG